MPCAMQPNQETPAVWPPERSTVADRGLIAQQFFSVAACSPAYRRRPSSVCWTVQASALVIRPCRRPDQRITAALQNPPNPNVGDRGKRSQHARVRDSLPCDASCAGSSALRRCVARVFLVYSGPLVPPVGSNKGPSTQIGLLKLLDGPDQ